MALTVDRADYLLSAASRSIERSFLRPLAAVGGAYTAYTLGRVVYRLADGIRVHFWPGSVNYTETFGSWAIVTGCTAGIGRSMALALAKRGMNVVLIARNVEGLEKLKELIESEYPSSRVMTIVADFGGTDFYSDIRNALSPLRKDIGLLVNNVAMIQEHPALLTQISDKTLLAYVNTNVTSVLMMSRIVLEMMAENRRGAVVNVSSGAANIPFPLLSAYSATKAFVSRLSDNLSYEYESRGITVQTLEPLGISTKMLNAVAGETRPSLLTPTPDIYVKHALSTLGRTNRTSGFWRHSLLFLLFSVLPGWLVRHNLTKRFRELSRRNSHKII